MDSNIAAFKKLHQHNLTIKQIDDPGVCVTGDWSYLDDTVSQLDYFSSASKPLLVYINLHAMLDSKGQVSLIVKNSDYLDDSSWLPLAALLEHIDRAVRKNRSILLLLDSDRQSDLLASTESKSNLASSLQKLVNDFATNRSKERELYVIASLNDSEFNQAGTGEGQLALLVSRALSGACDHYRNGGNTDHYVDFDELVRHISVESTSENVRAERNRSDLDRTCIEVFRTSNKPLSIAWTTSLAESHFSNPAKPISPDAINEIVQAWKQINQLAEQSPWVRYPTEWSQLNHLAIAIETCVMEQAEANRRDAINETTRQFNQKANELKRLLKQYHTDSLDTLMARQAAEIWKSIADSPSLLTVKKTIRPFSLPTSNQLPFSVPFLFLLEQQDEHQIWQSAEILKKLATAESKLEKSRILAAGLNLTPVWFELENQMDARRREVEDLLLSGSRPDDFTQRLDSFHESADEFYSWTTLLVQRQEIQYTIMAQFASLAKLVDCIDEQSMQIPPARTLANDYKEILEGLSQDDTLALAQDLSNGQSNSSVKSLEAKLLRFDKSLTQIWFALNSEATSNQAKTIGILDEFLKTNYFATQETPLEKAIELRISCRRKLSTASINNTNTPTNQSTRIGTGGPCERALRSLLTKNIQVIWSNNDLTTNTQKSLSFRSDLWNALKTTMAPSSPLNQSTLQAASCLTRISTAVYVEDTATPFATMYADATCQNRLLSAGTRALDDFWKYPLIESEPYYQTVAKKYIEAASAIEVRFNGRSSLQLLQSTWRTRQLAATEPLKLEVDCNPQWDDDSPSRSQCTIMPGPTIAGLPQGMACFSVSTHESSKNELEPSVSNRSVSQSDQTPIVVGPSMKTQKVVSQLSGNRTDSKPLNKHLHGNATVRYRGHEFSSPFEVRPARVNVSTGKIATAGRASILVQDQRPRRHARTIILDCSASMSEVQPIESSSSTPANMTSTTKLDAAKLALTSILNRWRNGSDLVGVMLYGHRVAVGTPQQGTLYQTRYYAKFPFSQSLQAFEDVETILPIGRFGDAEYSSVASRLEQVLPWGQTPLYLAIAEAIAKSGSAGPDVESHVIVISDGRNYQFNPTTEKNLSIEQTIVLAKEARTKVHVIGFGVPENEVPQASIDYQRLADETGGSYVLQIANSLQLIENLQAIIQPDQFVIHSPQGETWVGQCDIPFQLPTIYADNTPYVVEYREQRKLIPVNPYSAVQLIIGPQQRLVSSQTKAFGEPTISQVITPENQLTSFQLGVYPSRQQQNDRKFVVSLDRVDGEVAQRPRYLWIEIEPRIEEPSVADLASIDTSKSTAISAKPFLEKSNRNATTYAFADGAWIANTVNPTLQLTAEDWPSNALKADLKFWCTDKLPLAIHSIGLQDLTAVNGGHAAEAISGHIENRTIRYQLKRDKHGIILILFHEDTESNVLDIAPKLEGLPSEEQFQFQVERQYSNKDRMSIHRFRFDTAGNSMVQVQLENCVLHLFDTKDLKLKALTTVAPLSISLVEELATIPISDPAKIQR